MMIRVPGCQDLPTQGRCRGVWVVTLGLCVIIPALLVAAYLGGVLGPKPGSLSDSDCYVHLLRAEELWRTGRWYDPIVERSNAPYGEELHWTRPFDVLLLLGGVPASPFVGLRAGLFWWGVILSPVLLGVTLAVLGWVVRPLLGRDGGILVGLILACQIRTWLVFQPGRPDHHGLLMLLFLVCIGFTLRMILHPFSPSVCRWAGIVAALALWASIESGLIIGLSVIALAALWVVQGGDFLRKSLHYTVALCAGLILALVVERPLANLGAVELDRLSIAHCAAFGLVAGLWALIALCDSGGRIRGRTARLVALAAGSAVCAVPILVFLPVLARGPLGQVDPEVMRVYVRNVAEMKPMLASTSGRSLAVTVAGAFALCVPVLAWRCIRGPRSSAWLYVASVLLAFTPLSFLQIRWAPYTEAILALVVTGVIVAVWARIDRWPYTLKRTLAKTCIVTACCYFFLFSGVAVDTALSVEPETDREDSIVLAPICMHLAEAQPHVGRHLRILAHVFWGGEILYRTSHDVIGTPYHRNTKGILDTYRAFNAATDDQALHVIRDRGVNLILVAPGSNRIRRFYDGPASESTLYRRLCDGEVPSWCREVALPPDLDSFRLFEVRDEAGSVMREAESVMR